MAYCINPKCKQRRNPDEAEHCGGCGAPLRIRDRYRLVAPLRPLEAPGNAEIFQVEDLQCASGELKVLKVSKKSQAAAVQLLKQEAEILKALRHDGLPRVDDEDGYFTLTLPQRKKPLHALVMQQVPGENLQSLVERQGPVDPQQMLTWLKQLLAVLTYLHQRRYFHRDLKPSNIMLRPDGQLVLIDFGTVREVSHTIVERLLGRDITGMGIFSPGYTAPEQVAGRTVPQSDLYALGRTAVFLLTGQHPLDLKVNPKTGALLWHGAAPPMPAALTGWLDYLMAPLFWQRPPNAAFVLEQLTDGLAMPAAARSPSPPRWLLLLNLGLFVLLTTTALLWGQRYLERRREQSQAVATWQELHESAAKKSDRLS
ncbi:MAG: serine/threonine-protein kinase [Cyanobacteria bacterium P01_A01_bin.135]